MAREVAPPYPRRRRLLDRVREEIRTRHLSRRTERAYVGWIRRHVLFHGRRHPRELGVEDVGRFLTWLAVERRGSASTQNQAFAALLFLYRHVLHGTLDGLEGVVRAKRPGKCPDSGPPRKFDPLRLTPPLRAE